MIAEPAHDVVATPAREGAAIRVLLVEDDPAFARLLMARFSRLDEEVALEHASDLGEAVGRLSDGAFQAVLLDLNLPDSTGLDTYIRLSEAQPDTAVVILTGLADTQVAERAVRMGAQDYLPKDIPDVGVLARSVRYAVRRQRHLQDIEDASAAQLEAKNRFLSQVSHELRTPLAVVHGYVSLLADGIVEDQQQQNEFMRIVMNGTQQLSRMINDLLEHSRLQEGQLRLSTEKLDVSALVVECVAGMRVAAERAGVSLVLQEGSGLPQVSADPNRLNQVVFNLVDNAVKFTPEGGRVDVAVQAHDGGVVISVADTGPGIRGDNLGRVFDQYFQEETEIDTGHGGLGLGLYVCKQLVKLHGGRISVDSSPGTGSTFMVWLPAANGEGTVP